MKFFKQFGLNNTPEGYTVLLLCMFWGGPIMTFIKAIFIRVVGENIISLSIIPALFIIVFLLSWKNLSKCFSKGLIFFSLLCVLVFLLNYIFFPQNAEHLDDMAVPFLLLSLPIIFLGKAIDIQKMIKPFHVVSLLCIISIFLNVFFFERNEREMEGYDYDMSAAYIILPHLMMSLWCLLRKINIVDAIACIFGVFLLLGYGSRGPVLSVIVFVGLYLILFGFSKKKKWVSVLIVVGVFFAFTNINNVINFVSLGLEHGSLSVRITDAYLSGDISNDSGREMIQRAILKPLSSDEGILGLGICGDRVVAGQYSHNFLIELWASFGYVLGTMVFLSLVGFLCWGWRRGSGIEREFLIFLIAYLIHLFVSGTFLNSAFLFLTIGYCSRLTYKCKTQNLCLA